MQIVLRIAACAGIIAAGASSVHAEDDFIFSLRLRGGYDTNPQFSNGTGIGGSAFIGTDTALAAGTKEKGYSYGVAAEASTTQYANPLAVPALSGKVILRGTYGGDDANIAATTTIADTNTYNLRSSDLVQSIKGEVKFGSIKIFTTVEGARSSLNQTNAIFQDFLPNPQVYLRGTLIPGIAYVRDRFEIGASVNLSVRRYQKELDDFGYRRDNERVQPFLFAKYQDKDITVFGSISQLYGTFHDVDFTNVNTTLFDASLSWRIAPFTVDLAAYRRASETTFPISPITIDAAFTARASWLVEPKLTLTVAVGYATTDYLDSRFSAQTLSYGIGASHDLGNGYALGLDLTRAQGTLMSGEKASAIVISSSLTKKFSPFAKDEKKEEPKDKPAVTKS
ncbi:outer membrane beta-barrel protein [Afipia sp. DC4300-2b1]|uniref:outer membrane beta-barrel protein n=1 Tax=Afipia sp. DC4300-2b1 TaxID=2804672 RepID=UPI003CF40FD3